MPLVRMSTLRGRVLPVVRSNKLLVPSSWFMRSPLRVEATRVALAATPPPEEDRVETAVLFAILVDLPKADREALP